MGASRCSCAIRKSPLWCAYSACSSVRTSSPGHLGKFPVARGGEVHAPVPQKTRLVRAGVGVDGGQEPRGAGAAIEGDVSADILGDVHVSAEAAALCVAHVRVLKVLLLGQRDKELEEVVVRDAGVEGRAVCGSDSVELLDDALALLDEEDVSTA
jgi:hypothetical protein